MEIRIPITDRIVSPSEKELQYCGRIDWSNSEEPVFVYPCSFVTFRFTGTKIKIIVSNQHDYYDNYIGYILDGEQGRLLLPEDSQKVILSIGEELEDKEHEILLFKRMDGCHYFTLFGFVIDEKAKLYQTEKLPERRIEVYGDSVSAGEVSEALEYMKKPDPQHNGEYSNAWYSYTWITARKLGAQLHDIAQGGIALLDGTGWFCAPEFYGMEHNWDKIKYNPHLGTKTAWDFKKYTPHVVIVAIGQNDNHPFDYMKEDYNGVEAKHWRESYKKWICTIRKTYPKAWIVLTTTILEHDKNWDSSIEAVTKELQDPRIRHFLYSQNGSGTPGHIRIPEAEDMAKELSTYLLSLGDEIWED
ncbi:SGNH/GDSL hydrolase family protein [Anaerosporobacter faecicola]|uniref:electron transporter RnfD n=1 Tax=Anaerosporobacter faecicola TaxID=2718714 RepID=UPI00143989F2|nr:electron transporter RnfD [Anaerosporobacter faecicola]